MKLPRFTLILSSDGSVQYKSREKVGLRSDVATKMLMHCGKYLEEVKKKIGNKPFRVKLVYNGGKGNRVEIDASLNSELTIFDINVITEAFMKCLNELDKVLCQESSSPP